MPSPLGAWRSARCLGEVLIRCEACFLSIKKNTMVCEEAPALLLALVLLLAHTESAETADARGKNWRVPPRAPESAAEGHL